MYIKALCIAQLANASHTSNGRRVVQSRVSRSSPVRTIKICLNILFRSVLI